MPKAKLLRSHFIPLESTLNWRSLLLIALFPSSLISAQVTIPRILSDHMVVQRDLPVHVWGRATPGEQVSVTFRDENKVVAANRSGKVERLPQAGRGGWAVRDDGEGDSGRGRQRRGRCERRRRRSVIHDILVGDVWVASGQSNMEFPWSAQPRLPPPICLMPAIRASGC